MTLTSAPAPRQHGPDGWPRQAPVCLSGACRSLGGFVWVAGVARLSPRPAVASAVSGRVQVTATVPGAVGGCALGAEPRCQPDCGIGREGWEREREREREREGEREREARARRGCSDGAGTSQLPRRTPTRAPRQAAMAGIYVAVCRRERW